MSLQTLDTDNTRRPLGEAAPHVMTPTAAAKPASPFETTPPEAPPRRSTPPRSAGSVALHWSLMIGGFVALVLAGQWLL
ncbi:hypothetical protein [Paracoccus sp. KR1-242]|uniref:hypothetical protein n=1 Tax=Paracoccus sp. KR1-242 TaxID=3410028 RepID=UPI003C068D78